MALTPITSVSPSLAWRLIRCGHEVGLSRANATEPWGDARVSTSVALGNAAHAVLEKALKTEPLSADLDPNWFESEWATAIENQRTKCLDDSIPARWRRYSIVKRGTRRAVTAIRREASETGARPIVEETQFASDRPLWGRPDVVLAFDDGTAAVIDFKTGEHADGSPSERELQQLDLYALLVEETLHLDVVNLRILRAEGAGWQGTPSVERASDTWSKVEQAQHTYNAHLDDTLPLASPSEDCQRCRFAAQCTDVWRELPEGFVGVMGVLEVAYEESGTYTMQISTDDHTAVVAGCPDGDIECGQKIRIAHLRQLGDQTYRWQQHRSVLLRE